jgi:hypothetical protein
MTMKEGSDETLNASLLQFFRSTKSFIASLLRLLALRFMLHHHYFFFTENHRYLLHRRYFFKQIQSLTLHRH